MSGDILGDEALNRAYVLAQQASDRHREVCTKGCELEPPQRCTTGFRLRDAARVAWGVFEATLPRPVFGRTRR